MANQPILEIKHVYYKYNFKAHVLDDIQLTLAPGEFLGLVGPNGSGKTTLLKIILGLIRPLEGSVKLFGQSIDQFKDWQKIGYVSQKANSFNTGFPATVYEVVSTGLYGKMGLFRWIGKNEREKILATIKLVGLEEYTYVNIGKLSGGQQQRAFIARALVSDPQLLILDEPTVGVDGDSVDKFYQLLEQLRRSIGVTLLLVSHDIGVITSKVSTVACLNKKLHFHGAPDEFVQNQEAILASAYGHDVQLLEHVH